MMRSYVGKKAWLLIGIGLLLSLLCPAPGLAQSRPNPPMRFTHLTVEDGLAGPHVPTITQDRYGFMWFGTVNALMRYDGYTFVSYRHDAADPHSLSNDSINKVYTAPDGTLWIGTVSGVDRFDYETNTFTQYRHDPDDPASLAASRTRDLVVDAAGDLWIAQLGGLNRLDPVSGQIERFLSDPQNPDGLSHAMVWAVYVDSADRLWIGTSNGLDQFDYATRTFRHYHHDPEDPSTLSHNVVTSIAEDKAGNLWIGTEGGLNRLDPDTGTVERFMSDAQDPHSLSNNVVRVLLVDRAGVLWVGTENGLNRRDPATGAFAHFNHEPGNPHSLAEDAVIALYEDQAGTLWIGTTSTGISKLDPYANKFGLLFYAPQTPNGLNSNIINGLYEDATGDVWIGTTGGGLNRYTPSSGQFQHYRNDPADPTSVSDNIIVALAGDGDSTLWLGTWGNGLDKFDITTGQVTRHYRYDPDDPHSLANNVITALLLDAQGQLWVGTLGGGLNRLDPTTGNFTRYQYDAQQPGSLPDNRVYTLFQDSQGTLWVGLLGVGLARFDPATETFINYPPNAAAPQRGPAHETVSLIYEDRASGNLWIGTNGGLDKFDRATETFTHYTEQDGLPSTFVYGILEEENATSQDDGVYLWVSTTQGLARFDPSAETFRFYDTADGLQGLEFRHLAYLKSRSGAFYFGGTNGLNVFYPEQLHDNPYVPPVVLTDFQIFNQPISPSAAGPLERPIYLADDLTLSYQHTVFSLEFAALSYTAPEKNRYAYQMEGVDQDWVYVDSDRRFATYTNLDPGHYTFRVKASNNDGVWNETGTTLAITITPPWWATWWARTLALLAGLGAVVGGVQWRLYAIHQRNRELEAQVAARTQELRASEMLLQKTQQLARLGGWELHVPTRHLTWTAEVARIFGLPPEQPPDLEEVLGFYIPEHQPLIRAAVERGAQEGIPWDLELEIVTARGERRWTRNIGNAEVLDDQVVRLSGSFQDITVLKEAELALRESEERFRLAFEHSSAGMCLVGLDGRFLQVNQQLGEMFGYPSADLVGMHVNDLAHPDYIEVSPTFIKEATTGSVRHTQFEKLYYHRDGHLIWGQVVSALARDEHGEPLYFISHVLDITERKQAETRLRESEERFAAVMNSMEAIIYVADMDTHEVLFMNQYARGLFGDGEGQICWQVFQAGQSGPCAFCTNHRLLTDGGEPVGIIAWEMQNTVNGRWYHIQDQAIRWTDGRLVRLEVATDITQIKGAEQQVLAQQRQLAMLEERERIGRELHDDLGQVMGYVNMQAQTALDLLGRQRTPQAEAALVQLVQVAQSAQHDVREYILGIRQPGAVTDDFSAALRKYLHALQQRYDLTVQLSLPDDLPLHFLAVDVEVQLLRVLQEALTNVARHAGVDSARLTLTLDDDWVMVMIADAGVGFALDAPDARSPHEPEAHFGLEIMRERIASVGGSLEVTTAPGEGTQVAVKMPRVLAPSRADAAELDHDSARALRVLLVDDHPLFLEGLYNMLSARGLQVVGMARDGLEALAMAQQLRPEVILMDVNMPQCDGVTATRRILAELPDIKIVMLTVAADDDTLFAALKNGASGYLLKSLDSATLFRMLSDLMRGETVIAPGLAKRVLMELVHQDIEEENAPPGATSGPATTDEQPTPATGEDILTDRQLEVLQWVAQGLTYKEIGQRLFISERTVKYHMGEIMERLHLKNREQVALYAQQEGWIEM